MSFFNKLFGEIDAGGTITDPKRQAGKELSISKLFAQINLIERSYELNLFSDSAATKHDLTVMHEHGDLRSMTVELVGHDERVLIEFKWTLDANGHSFHRIDSAGGVELPVIDRTKLAKHRFLVRQGGRQREYQHVLKLNWSPAPAIAKAAGASFESEHNGRITGGRTRGEFFVGDAVRHELLVEQTGARGYAFARDLTISAERVFLLAKFAPPGFQFRVGQRLTAVVVQTPKGLQARSIQPV
jgi:hypothetical protein